MACERRNFCLAAVSLLSMIIPSAIIIGITKSGDSKGNCNTSTNSTNTTTFSCPSPFTQNGSHCYYLARIRMNQADSKKLCTVLNSKSKLISIDDEAEFDVVKEYLRTADQIGCGDSDGAYTCGFYSSNTWTWQETGATFVPGSHLVANPMPLNGNCMTIQLPDGAADAYKYIPVDCLFTNCPLCEI